MKKNLSEPELKAIIDDILNKYLNFIGARDISGIIFDLIRKQYVKGLEEAEVEFNMNFMPNPQDVQFMQKFAFENVQSLTDEVKDKLRKELSLGLMNNESGHKLYKRVSEVMDMSIERAKMITITETNRAQNRGFHQAAKETGIKLYKQWNAQPERVSRAGNLVPCKHCEFLDNQVVGMDDMFTDEQGQKFFLPPHHPNCFPEGVMITTINGKKDIKDIKINDEVLTHKNKFRKVLDKISRKVNEDLIVIETSRGKIKMTKNHPVMTNTGWKEAQHITKKDMLLFVRS